MDFLWEVTDGGFLRLWRIFFRGLFLNFVQYEGYTLIPMIDDFKQRFSLGKDFIVVADSGLMNTTNVNLLRQAGYKYIIGARIKSEGSHIKQWILQQNKEHNCCHEYERRNGERLILHYSETRAKKDAYNRERSILPFQSPLLYHSKT